MAASEGQNGQEGVGLPSQTTSNIPSPDPSDAEKTSEDEVNMDKLTDEDAQSLLRVSISRVASRLASSTTPAAEKAAAMEKLGGDYVESDEETPTAEYPPPLENAPPFNVQPSPPDEVSANHGPQERQLILPPPKTDIVFPTPWQAGPKRMVVQRPEPSRSALRDAFAPTRPRSFSGSETLRKFLPSLSSIPKAGSIMSSMPSPTFFSSFGSNQTSKSKTFPSPKRDPRATPPAPASPIILPAPILSSSPPATRALSTHIEDNEPNTSNRHSDGAPKNILIRSNSDDSLLYHSVSRTSSLGDDSRFEDHHEMINSRLKAIKDTYKDRSSFRLPNFPSMPNVPIPSLDFNNFSFNLGSATQPTKGRQHDTRRVSLHGDMTPTIAPGIGSLSISKTGLAAENGRHIHTGSHVTALDHALSDLKGDVVIMGGYRGSILRSTETHKQVWIPIKVGLNIRKVNLEVGLEPEDE